MNTTSQMRDDLAGARESITSGELFTGDDLAVRDGANSRRENEMDLDQFEGHTPGPLACVELMAFAAGFAVEDGEGRTVARIMKTHGVERLPSRANAALFAAAPELLAEVRRLTAEAAELRRERDELAARLETIERAEPVQRSDCAGWAGVKFTLEAVRAPCGCQQGTCESKADRRCRMADEVKPGSGAQ